MAEVKPEEMVHHPPMDQLQGFEYCIDSNPSWGMCHVTSHWSIHVIRLWIVLCIQVADTEYLCECYRGSDGFGFSALRTVTGHCCDDPHNVGSYDGWK
jgi:hypothetical protein